MVSCKECSSTKIVKARFLWGKQRYKCKDCGCRYTKSSGRGYPPETRHFALKLYLEGLGFRAIERILNVSNVAVMKWVRQAANQFRAERPPYDASGRIMEIDEMWHYVGKKPRHLGVAGC